MNSLTPGRAIWPNNKHRKDQFFRGKVQNIVNVLMEVFYYSLSFHLMYFMLHPEKRSLLWVLTVK